MKWPLPPVKIALSNPVCNISDLSFPFSYDYVIITNEKDFTFGEYVYCGQRTGQTVLITGRLAVIYFYSDNAVEERGFLLLFSITPHGMYNITE